MRNAPPSRGSRRGRAPRATGTRGTRGPAQGTPGGIFRPCDWCSASVAPTAGFTSPRQILVSWKPSGQTTAVVCLIQRDDIVGASVGDSGAWIIDGDGADELT